MSWQAPYPAERLVPYDDAWPATAARLADDLVAVLGPDWVVEQVGSTSVPGLVAKPVVDLAVLVAAGVDGASYTAAKRDLVQAIVNRARAARGWPLVELPP